MTLPFPAGAPEESIVCSAKGCRDDATRVLVWANPTLHHGGRTKTWAACDAHEADLAEYERRTGEEGRGPLPRH